MSRCAEPAGRELPGDVSPPVPPARARAAKDDSARPADGVPNRDAGGDVRHIHNGISITDGQIFLEHESSTGVAGIQRGVSGSRVGGTRQIRDEEGPAS